MDKNKIVNFGTLIIASYIIVILVAIVFKQTGFYQYKDHTARYFEDEKHLTAYFRNESYSNYLASTDGVQANMLTTGVGIAAKAAGKLLLYSPGAGLNSKGFGYTMMTQTVDNTGHIFIGCAISDYQEYKDGSPGSENKCKPDDFYYNNLDATGDTASNNNGYMANGVENGSGLFGFANTIAVELNTKAVDTVNFNIYAQKSIEEIPFVGQKVNAAPLLGDQLTNVALGEGFYNVWKASRNLAYYLIIIPTLAFGFAIMFRVQINPQTQITLMRAIPRLLTVILLITFSYPLSALVVQLMGPLHDAAVALVKQFGAMAMPEFTGATVWQSFFHMITDSNLNVATRIGSGLFSGLFIIIMMATAFIVFIRYLLAAFIITIKIGFTIAFSPLILLIAAFPGKQDVIKQYFINLTANVIGFGLISVMFVTSWVVLQMAIQAGSLLPYLGFSFVSLAILWKSPSAPKMIREAMGAKSFLSAGDSRRR